MFKMQYRKLSTLFRLIFAWILIYVEYIHTFRKIFFKRFYIVYNFVGKNQLFFSDDISILNVLKLVCKTAYQVFHKRHRNINNRIKQDDLLPKHNKRQETRQLQAKYQIVFSHFMHISHVPDISPQVVLSTHELFCQSITVDSFYLHHHSYMLCFQRRFILVCTFVLFLQWNIKILQYE